MYQRDYILRIIEQLGRALVQLRRRLLGEQLTTPTLRQELRSIADQAGLNLELVRAVDAQTLPILLAPGGELEPARCWLAAELLYLDALHARESGRSEETGPDVRRAVELYQMLPPDWAPPPGIPDHEQRLAELRGWGTSPP